MSLNTRKYGLVPLTTTALLSNPSKMPGFSWSLPAHRSCPRANGSICDKCYAVRGNYTFPSVQRAFETRFKWTVEAMRSPEGRSEWIATMSRAIAATKQRYFRVHDSGDMFNLAYVQAWISVTRALPRVRFWVPTRAWQVPKRNDEPGAFTILNDDPLLAALRELASLPNVTVRPSALNFGDEPPSVAGLHAGSTAAHASTRQCPAHKQGNQCGACRVCWTLKDTAISYQQH